MTKRMLIDATHAEETRVAVVDGTRLVDFDYESKVRKQLKGGIFLAKVTRVEPSLQAAFVNFGGNRHAFLPFSEIHPDYFRIPIADREALLEEQRLEMEERQAQEEAAEAAEAAAIEAGQSPEAAAEGEESDEAEESVEELGGETPLSAEEEAASEQAAGDTGTEEQPDSEDAPFGDSEEAGFEGDAAPFDGEGDDVDPAAIEAALDEAAAAPAEGEAQAGEGQPAEGQDQQGNGGRRGRGRGRGGRDHRGGRGRGRDRGGRGGDRMASRHRRVEMLGGDGVEGDHPVRPSLRRNYKIQEVVKRGQIMLIQVSKEERGNKGAAVTTYLSLPGRYCVLMPNSPRAGGVSRKIANFQERRRMRELLSDLEVPQGMSVIMRTAGMSRTPDEIKRDLDYLTRLWDNIRDKTLQSTAPAMIHEEGNLIRRSIRDIYARDVGDIYVAGEEGYAIARDFMEMMIPSNVNKVHLYKDEQMPLFSRFQVESQISAMGEATVPLRSGGYLVINPTEALVSIDVNSGRATRERDIEGTALKTNLEAAEEVARQLRLRDLGGLVVIDFIDMEDRRHNRKVEEKLRNALSSDRARIQLGRISSFGLLELSRQRLNPSLTEAQFERCAHCEGTGHTRTVDSAAIMALRALEEEGGKNRAGEVVLKVPGRLAIYILNHKRQMITDIERRYGFSVLVGVDDALEPSRFVVEPVKGTVPQGRGDEDESREDNGLPQPDDLRAEDETNRSNHQNNQNRSSSERSSSEEGGENFGGRNRDHNRDRGERSDRDDRDGGRRRGRRGGRNRNRNRDDRPGGRPQQGGEGFGPSEESIGNQIAPVESDDSFGDSQADFGLTREAGEADSQGNGGYADPAREGGRRDRGERGGRGRRGGRNRNRGGRDRDHRGGDRNNGNGGGNNNGGRRQWRDNDGNIAAAPAASGNDNGYEASPATSPAREAASGNERPARSYESVNEPDGEKKKGWWKRLTE